MSSGRRRRAALTRSGEGDPRLPSALSERAEEIVRRALRVADVPSEYRRLSEQRWRTLRAPFALSEASLDRIRSELPVSQREIAFACVAHGNCLRACATFEILSGGRDRAGKPLRRFVVGRSSPHIKVGADSPYHAWIVCSQVGRIDPTEEQIRHFLPSVRYERGRPSRTPRYRTAGRLHVAPPFARLRFAPPYVGVLRRACDLLLAS